MPRVSRGLQRELLHPLDDFFDVLAAVERADAEVAFAAGAEAAAGRDHDVRFVEHAVEPLPACQAFWACDPDKRCVDAAMNIQTDRHAALDQNPSAGHVVID